MLDGGAVEALEVWETAMASKTLMKQPAVLACSPWRDWQDSAKVMDVDPSQSLIRVWPLT